MSNTRPSCKVFKWNFESQAFFKPPYSVCTSCPDFSRLPPFFFFSIALIWLLPSHIISLWKVVISRSSSDSLTGDRVKQCCWVARSLLLRPQTTHLHFVPLSSADSHFTCWDVTVSFLAINSFISLLKTHVEPPVALHSLSLSCSDSRCSAFFGQWTVLYSLCRESTHALFSFVLFSSDG